MALLEARDIGRRFGGLQALDKVSLHVAERRIQAVIGPNGAGKTTFFNVLTGLLRPDSGTVRFRDTDITGAPPHRIAALGMSRTFQTPSLFPSMSALENVMVGRHPRTRHGFLASIARLPGQVREERAIREAALEQLRFAGAEALADRPVGALSFGQRRMVELARALATEPRLLLLDEPAAGLNDKETGDLAELIRRIRESGVAVLLVDHDMSLVMDVSDEILVLHYGTPIASGTPAEVNGNPRVVDVYLGGGLAECSK